MTAIFLLRSGDTAMSVDSRFPKYVERHDCLRPCGPRQGADFKKQRV